MEILAVDLLKIFNNLTNVGLAAIGLGLVIFLHELGHFAVAKWCNVFVERFSIGFGPVLFSRKWGETEYALSLIPFGGYVKMLGQDDADPSQLTNEEIAQDPRSYVAKSVFQRMAIISAGVIMNVLTALLFFVIVFKTGFPTSPSQIGNVRPGMPAWEAGLDAGDRINKINDSSVSTFPELQLAVALSSGPLKLEGTHADGSPFQVTVNPDASGNHPRIGVTPMESLTVYQISPSHATARATPPFRRGDRIQKVNDTPVATSVDFHREVAANAGATLTVTVQRAKDENGETLPEPTTETITITDNFFRTLGLTLDSGPIAAVRQGSPAEKAGLRKNDKLAVLDGLNIGTQIDPLKLPVEFAKRAGKEIEVIVTRQNTGAGQESVTLKLTPDNIPGWLDQPVQEGEPLSIPSIGAAFHILPVILSVEPGSSAEKLGVKPGPIKKLSLTRRETVPPTQDEIKDAVHTINLDDADGKKNRNNCAFAFWRVQQLPDRKVTLTVLEDGKLKDIELEPQPDPEWPLPIIGLGLEAEQLVQKADTLGQACMMSFAHTKSSALNIYLTLRSLVTGRVSYKELHGPLGIANAAYQVAQQGWIAMLLFLGFLSVNLAVLNFLPIPVLDGGHMVFLIWEAVTRRRPSERVMIGATYAGFAFLLCLMALVLYLDLFIHPFAKK
ncbi:RIP metalloprotease RseP [Schlesneria sp. T3-172]|uniref:RIP metalloprotease RseP n=1 Tax=Schlesneria sphaerica TaxID=3373610 RepID=UPI0037C6DC8E